MTTDSDPTMLSASVFAEALGPTSPEPNGLGQLAIERGHSGRTIAALRDLRRRLGSRSELQALDALHQRAWERDVEASIERAAETLPEDPGPLNSGMLVVKALHAMEARGPEYLRYLVSYLDTLCWLEEQS